MAFCLVTLCMFLAIKHLHDNCPTKEISLSLLFSRRRQNKTANVDHIQHYYCVTCNMCGTGLLCLRFETNFIRIQPHFVLLIYENQTVTSTGV